jgi:hypothetical protein
MNNRMYDKYHNHMAEHDSNEVNTQHKYVSKFGNGNFLMTILLNN